MNAVILQSVGDRNKLEFSESHRLPILEDGQILVKNNFAGINFVDIYLRTGHYPSASGYPLILGQEGAGTVVSVAGFNPLELKPGDRVVWIGNSGYAEYTAVNAGQISSIPDGISDQDAVAGHLAGMTALSLMQEAYPAKKGDTVLVHAAAGGVGSILCQLLKDEGVTVIATAGGSEKCTLVKGHGATHVIDYKDASKPTWVEQVLELTGGNGVNAVYDGIGKDTWQGSIQVTRRKGKVVFYGSSSGPVPPLDLSKIRRGNVSVIQPTLSNYITTREELDQYAQGILMRQLRGQLKVNVSQVYGLEEIAQAHKDMEERRSTGKLLMKL
ncbi:quinone reductase [Diaporthe amygdali]|uniref:quinone reductase n=1 Tax=Phomopsis amygdali TaxID=1214568 RepID=UPI0022FDF816|nr:quinone reductase [Diaporthe amygdali]KAJ0115120.1 quinone reductase [Diaporthe amygdali]